MPNNKDYLEIEESGYQYRIVWCCFCEDGEFDIGASLGECMDLPETADIADKEHIVASNAAKPFATNKRGTNEELKFETEAIAKKALRAAKAAIKALKKDTPKRNVKTQVPEKKMLSFDVFYDEKGPMCHTVDANCYFLGDGECCFNGTNLRVPKRGQVRPNKKCPFHGKDAK